MEDKRSEGEIIWKEEFNKYFHENNDVFWLKNYINGSAADEKAYNEYVDNFKGDKKEMDTLEEWWGRYTRKNFEKSEIRSRYDPITKMTYHSKRSEWDFSEEGDSINDPAVDINDRHLIDKATKDDPQAGVVLSLEEAGKQFDAFMNGGYSQEFREKFGHKDPKGEYEILEDSLPKLKEIVIGLLLELSGRDNKYRISGTDVLREEIAELGSLI